MIGNRLAIKHVADYVGWIIPDWCRADEVTERKLIKQNKAKQKS